MRLSFPKHLVFSATIALVWNCFATAQEVRPARPVDGDVPVRPARPVDDPPVRPARPVDLDEVDPVVVEEPAPPPGDLLRPDPGNDLLELADMLFERGDLEFALFRYNQFTEEFPNHPRVRYALFRAAESLRRLDRADEAEQRFALIVDRFREGDMVGAAAFRAAALAYNRRDYRMAVPYFRTARRLLDGEDERALKLEATFRLALSLQQLGEEREALEFFQEVAQAAGENPHREAALLAVARISANLGREDEALDNFRALAEESEDISVRAEALVRTALLDTEAGRTDSAAEKFREVMAFEGAEAWKAVAQFGLIRALYREKDYEGVVDAYHAGVYQLSDEMRAQMFLMTGNAMQRLGRHADAVKVYGILENFYEGQPEGQEAGYRRLESLYRQEDPDFIAFANHYITSERERGADHSFIDRAIFLKAETLFERREMAAAAEAYGEVRIDRIPAELVPALLYKKAWAEADSGQGAAAIETLGRFIVVADQEDERVGLALAKRGELSRAAGNSGAALDDFMAVIEGHPDSEALEFSYQQAAMIRQAGNDIEGMVALFRSLLERFPETTIAAEAHYWIGRGSYQLRRYEDAVPALRMAREMDPERYARPAGSRLVLSAYAMTDHELMSSELDRFLEDFSAAELPAQVIAWLGVKLYEEGDSEGAARYLGMASNSEEPRVTEPVIWKYLAKALLDEERFDEAVKAAEFYLDVAESAGDRADTLYDKAFALFRLGRYDEADEAAQKGQGLLRQGRLNARLALLRGEVAMARGEPEEAAAIFAVISQTIVDPALTPLALRKLVDALEAAGNREEARRFRQELRERYPDFAEDAPEL